MRLWKGDEPCLDVEWRAWRDVERDTDRLGVALGLDATIAPEREAEGAGSGDSGLRSDIRAEANTGGLVSLVANPEPGVDSFDCGVSSGVLRGPTYGSVEVDDRIEDVRLAWECV
eukprot:1332217-Amorphochlora_amoeboformis.AAC.1